MEEEANCEKEERKKSQERNKLGGIPPNLIKERKKEETSEKQDPAGVTGRVKTKTFSSPIHGALA